MTTPNARKGAETERVVAKYLRTQGFPLADRRLREGRRDDQGDIEGVPFTTIQVKFEKANRYQEWINATLRQREMAGTPLCLLVRRTLYKPVEQWEALMPSSYFVASFEHADGTPIPGQLDEAEAWTWVRLDLRMAVFALKRMTQALSSLSSLNSTTSTFPGETKAPVSAPSMEKGDPPSPTT